MRDSISQQPNPTHKAVLAVLWTKRLTWLSLVWLFALGVLVPVSPTLPRDEYLYLFGPVTGFSVMALAGFVIGKLNRVPVSWAYAFAPAGVLFGTFYMTGFVLRLRWHLIFP